MQHLHTNPKYQLLRARGYTHNQITEMIVQQQQQHTQQPHTQQHTHLRPPVPFVPADSLGPPGPSRPPPTPPSAALFAPTSVDQRFHTVHEARRLEAAYAHPRATESTHVAPRAPVNLQPRADKSAMESVFQQAFQSRQHDGGLVTDQHVPLLPENRTFPPMPPPVRTTDAETCRVAPTRTRSRSRSRSPPTPYTAPPTAPSRTAPPTHPHAQRFATYQAEMAALAQTETDAHALLGIGTEYDLRALAKAYRKAALKYHPDRVRKHAAHLTAAQQAEANGMFARVTKAYLLLMDTFQRRQQDQPFDELRQASRAAGGVDGATGMTETVPTRPRVRLMKGDKFDANLFNRIYDENRLGDVYDDGHGGWLTAEIPAEQQTETLFSGKFNKRVFNATFDQLKRADPNAQRQLVKRAEPEALVLSGSASSVATLGEDAVRDFGGSSGGLEYSDLKEAHTTNATLLDASRAEAETETFRDVKALQAHRAGLSHQRTEKDLARDALRQRETELAEQARQARLVRRDQLAEAQQARLGGLLMVE